MSNWIPEIINDTIDYDVAGSDNFGRGLVVAGA